MKKVILAGLSLILFACAPALNKDLLKQGVRNPSLDELRANPAAYKGKLFILGGTIIETRLAQNGSLLEVLSYPVDSRGYLENAGVTMGRFVAVYPRERGLLDPIVYKKGRVVALAAVFLDAEKRKIDDMEYVYPVFEIRQIHLWAEEPGYYGYPYYPYYYYPGPYWYNPYWGPYWGPWPGW